MEWNPEMKVSALERAFFSLSNHVFYDSFSKEFFLDAHWPNVLPGRSQILFSLMHWAYLIKSVAFDRTLFFLPKPTLYMMIGGGNAFHIPSMSEGSLPGPSQTIFSSMD
jgi:hypothetical protein